MLLVTMYDCFISGGRASPLADNVLVGDAAERFGTREAEKFRFLGE